MKGYTCLPLNLLVKQAEKDVLDDFFFVNLIKLESCFTVGPFERQVRSMASSSKEAILYIDLILRLEIIAVASEWHCSEEL